VAAQARWTMGPPWKLDPNWEKGVGSLRPHEASLGRARRKYRSTERPSAPMAAMVPCLDQAMPLSGGKQGKGTDRGAWYGLATAAASQLVHALDDLLAVGPRGQGKAGNSLTQHGVPEEIDIVQLDGHGARQAVSVHDVVIVENEGHLVGGELDLASESASAV